MTQRAASMRRQTTETDIRIEFNIDGAGRAEKITTEIPFFDHMLNLFTLHGFFDLSIHARGDIDIDAHHTMEDVGLVLGDVLRQAVGERKGIRRYGHAVTPMDEALVEVTVDISNRPFLVYNVPADLLTGGTSHTCLTKEFLRAFAVRGGLTLHVNVSYGENEHHVIEAMFKAMGRALDQALSMDSRIQGVQSSKGVL